MMNLTSSENVDSKLDLREVTTANLSADTIETNLSSNSYITLQFFVMREIKKCLFIGRYV